MSLGVDSWNALRDGLGCPSSLRRNRPRNSRKYTPEESDNDVELDSTSSQHSTERSALDATSPSLRKNHDATAFEIKFLLPFAVAKEVLERARRQMQLDPHCDPQLGEAYEVHGLYFDTDDFHVYHRVNSHAVHKLRLRRYGRMQSIFLEHKAKVKGRVRKKRRTPLDDGEIPLLFGRPLAGRVDWFLVSQTPEIPAAASHMRSKLPPHGLYLAAKGPRKFSLNDRSPLALSSLYGVGRARGRCRDLCARKPNDPRTKILQKSDAALFSKTYWPICN